MSEFMWECEHLGPHNGICEECQEEDRLECLAIDRETNKYTWDDVCYTNNCTHDNPKCGAWEELNYTETLDYYN